MPKSVANTGFAYRAFLSYSHADRAWCDWLHKALETYRVPSRLVGKQTAHGTISRKLTPIFRDRDELPSAHDLNDKVGAALAQSENLVVICSPRSAQSRWVNEEVLAYKRLGRAERIFCLIVEGEPNASDIAGREAEECFCPGLRFQLGANGELTHERTEPIAADARAGKDGKANAKLKLIAGMLDVGFDALKQRELQRRNRRMTAIAALALIVMLVTSALAINAVIARRAAQVAQAAAERRQKQAEDLVGFMLGDLNDKLAQQSKLDIMQAVDDKAMAYFQSLPSTDISDTALAQRAKALEKIGSVRMDQGQLPGALEAFHASTAISARLAEAKPTDVERQVAYSRTLAFIGMVYWNLGELNDAQRAFEVGQQGLRALQAQPADYPPALFQLAILDNDIGHVLEARGLPDAAELEYHIEMALTQKLVVIAPHQNDYLAELGKAHNNLGKLALQRGDLAAAVNEYGADDAIETRLSARDPKDNDQREKTAILAGTLGRTLALMGNVTAGLRELRRAVGIVTRLTAFDQQDTSFQEDEGLYSSQLSRLQRLSGDLAAANTSNATSIAVFASLTRSDPGNTGWQREYAEALIEQAAQSLSANQIGAAHDQAQAALHILAPLLAQQPDDHATVLATAQAKLLLADVSADAQIAQTLREQALKTMQSQKTGQGDPRLLALHIQALLALGKNTEAQPLIKQLWNSGYRDLALVDLLQRVRIDYPVNPAFQQKLLAAGRPENTNTHSNLQASDKARK